MAAKKTQGQILFEKTQARFVDIFNEQIKLKQYPDSKSLFFYMYDEYKKIIEDLQIKRKKNQWLRGKYFMYQLAQAAFKSDVFPQKLDHDLPQKIWDFIYGGMVLTALHNCPDVEIGAIKKLIKDDQCKLMDAQSEKERAKLPDKHYILINDKNVFSFTGKHINEVKAKLEQPFVNHSKEVIIREYENNCMSELTLAKKAIGGILKRLNAHNNDSGRTVGVELNMVDEMNDLTVALSKLNNIVK